MNALIAFRRLVTPPQGNPFYQVRIAVRSYACFNGFNIHGAFLPNGSEADAMFLANQNGTTQLHLSGNWYDSLGCMERVQGIKGQWETLAIGWLYSGARKASSTETGSPVRTGDSDTTKYDWKIGMALCSEGFQKQYYDGYNGQMLRTKRELTPNEEFLSNCFSNLATDSSLGIPQDAQKRSFFATALAWSRHYCHNLFQFVGSERPSGQAVSYLQTFRNISEAQYSGWRSAMALKRTVLLQVIGALRTGGNFESPMPFFDVIHNHGTDNAIVAYADAPVMLHMVRHGFWSAREFYGNTTSMLNEGRYNKGNQTLNLKTKFSEAFAARHGAQRLARIRSEVIDSRNIHVFDQLKATCGGHVPSLTDFSNTDRVMLAASSDDGMRQLLGRYESALRHYRNLGVGEKINRILELVRGDLIGDARTPPPAPAPVTPPQPTAPVARPAQRTTQPASESATPRNTTAGAAQGFVQWTAGATLH